MKMKGLFSLIFAFVPLYIFAACPEPPKGIPNNPLGEGFAFAFPSVVALEGNETRPAVFYKVHQTDIVEIYDPFGVLVKRFEPGDRNEVTSGKYIQCAYKWYGESGTGKPVSPGIYLAVLRFQAGGALGGSARRQYVLVKVPPKLR
jgi:hypothetical protein